jgi:hypothetical protein
MKAPAELIDDAARALNQMEDNCAAVYDYAGRLSVLTAGPDAETAIDGIHRRAQVRAHHLMSTSYD